jgi:hypothetical protein
VNTLNVLGIVLEMDTVIPENVNVIRVLKAKTVVLKYALMDVVEMANAKILSVNVMKDGLASIAHLKNAQAIAITKDYAKMEYVCVYPDS